MIEIKKKEGGLEQCTCLPHLLQSTQCDSWEVCALCPSYRKCSVTHSWALWNKTQKILITAKY